MKIYIHTDMEGIAGIGDAASQKLETGSDPDSRLKLMAELNAVVAGAFDGGATHVTALDSHGGGDNFLPELLDKRCDIDRKPNHKWWGSLNESYAGTFFIGAHAMAGTLDAFLDHTQSSGAWLNYSVNGRRFGELAQWAMVAGVFNVPLLLVTGDEAACAEARGFFTPIETVAVKQGMGRQKARLYPLDATYARIRAAAARAVALAAQAKPFKPALPMEIVLEFTRTDYGDEAAAFPGVERIDARTIRWRTSDPLKLFFWYL